MNEILLKVFNPDYHILLHYPDNLIPKKKRLLANLAKLGRNCIKDNKLTPFIRVKEAETGNIIFNDMIAINHNLVNENIDTDYILDILLDADHDKKLYTCLYKNTDAPLLHFDTLSFEYPFSTNNILTYLDTKKLVLDKHKSYLKESDSILVLIHTIKKEPKT